jgi:coenzyme F420-reducing hydrogenase delta subunit/ferredoxin
MSGANGAGFEPKILAYVCNWCTYLGADLAGTARLEYPPNVRIVRLPCTGRIDANLVVKAFEMGSDAVLVSGCHPGDCHYTAGNYHARRRWMFFRRLLEILGFDLRRLHFSWISAAEGKKFQQVITEITEQTRALGPYRPYEATPRTEPLSPPDVPAAAADFADSEEAMRGAAARLLAEGKVKVVIGYGERGPAFVTRAEDAGKLVWNGRCFSNLAVYLKRKETRALGPAAVVVKGCDERALVALEKESQLDRGALHVIGMACGGMGRPKCSACETPRPRFADETIGGQPNPAAGDRYAALARILALSPEERLSFWTAQFDRCVKCYACRAVCPMCYCERCLADKNRPQAIPASPHRVGNFSWHMMRAMHLAGRCVGCDECTRACPAGIDLGLLNLAMAEVADREFDYRAGIDPAAEPPVGSFAVEDREEFIR